MGMMIVRHKVRDYGQWRPIFDRHAEMQRAAGLINPRVYHSADSNKSEIVSSLILSGSAVTHAMKTRMHPGMVLVTTDDRITAETRTAARFSIITEESG